tara:strand:+ start:350 stop:937 length:588 start_codon:yes stop_codon:yes gene_type:complete
MSEMLHDLVSWVLAWGESPFGALALFILAFWESSFFPVPPDGLMIVLMAGNPGFVFAFAGLATVGSIMGAGLGYAIGLKGGRPVLTKLFSESRVEYVERQYQSRDVWAVSIAAFTPIPYKVFAIGAGVCRLNFRRFLLASLIGRGGRFFSVAIMVTVFGQQIQHAIENYLNVLSILFIVVLIMGFLIIRFAIRRN